ncbi:amylovoran biosynthesis protein [Serratia phage vB_SmaS-Totoro]|nr:amylovoran biosynthesis protein [Serratia phage vB_SmaS-Totoro]
MADNTSSKISQLPDSSNTGINDSDIIPASRIVSVDQLETQKVSIGELRKLMDYGNAYSNINDGVAATIKGQQFFSFVDSSKEYVYRYVNMGGIASPVLDVNGKQVKEPTKELIKNLEQIRSSIGFGLIGQIKSFDELRATEPYFPGQRVLVTGYREGANYGGGEFFHDPADKTTVDNGGTVAVTPGAARWKRAIVDTSTNQAEWWGVHYSQADNAQALKKAADASRKKILMLPQGSNANPIVIRSPIVFQTNCGIKLRGCGVKDSTTISVQIGPGYETYGALHFPGRNPTTNAMEAGFAGIEISNIQLLGNLSTCRGIYLQYQYQSLFSYVNVERFNGAGVVTDESGTPVVNLTPKGLASIRTIPTMAALRATKPKGNNEIVDVREYYAGKMNGGGRFVSATNTTVLDDGGYTTIRYDDNTVWYRQDLRALTLWDGGCDNSVVDNGPFIQNIQYSRSFQPIKVPSQYFGIRTPIVIQANKGFSLYADSTHTGRAVLQWMGGDFNDATTAVLSITIDKDTDFTYSGVALKGFSILGGGKVLHGLYMRNVGYPEIDSLKIENFKGAGLLLDQVQDGYYNFLEVQMCGRTSGDYATYADLVNLTKTTFAPIHIISSKSGDASNMLRFQGGQWEANNVSPTVYYRGGIGLWISKIHCEQRNGPLSKFKYYDPNFVNGTTPETAGRVFIQVDGSSSSEVLLDSMQSSETERFVYASGYGNVTISNTTRGGGICLASSNREFAMSIQNSWLTDCYFGPSSRVWMDNCRLGNVTWNYPSYTGMFSNTVMKALSMNNDGSFPDINFSNCVFDSVVNYVKNVRFIGGHCIGDFTFNASGGGGAVIGTAIDGTVSVDTKWGIDFRPSGKYFNEVYSNVVPTEQAPNGTRPNGSIWINKNVSATAPDGTPVAYVKNAAGAWIPYAFVGTVANGMVTKEYTFANLPGASLAKRAIVTCTDTAKTPKDQLIYSDGTNWRYVADPATVVTKG